MNLRWVGSLGPMTILVLLLPVVAGVDIRVDGYKLLVDGVPVHIKGVNWSPVARGERKADFGRFASADIALMAKAGINAVRTYDPITNLTLLDELWAHRIWVLNTVYTSGGLPIQSLEEPVRKTVGHPAILMWVIGNEWNYNGLYAGLSLDAAVARVKEAAELVKTLDLTHPVASVYGELPPESVVSRLSDVDIWGINAYDGKSFGGRFNRWACQYRLPMFFAEFGADAFDARSGTENDAAQAEATRALALELVAHSAVREGGTVLGGFVFELADEWWKDGRGNASDAAHDTGGSAPGWGPYPDRTYNEEWWGLADIDRRPRQAYFAYKAVPLPDSSWSPADSTGSCGVRPLYVWLAVVCAVMLAAVIAAICYRRIHDDSPQAFDDDLSSEVE
eukprot:TRINITY_DN46789_c0_g1_i1.p1 TRINITY_DN46789_c0_g1~~TRINITY_DN46789_c0_g1_i1.p1  ORF type:complete len:393 (-),score=36.76 TRINITY_DN46789_c0_g1_i1:109-1287(-)